MVEIELKYAISEKGIAENIWNDPYIVNIEENDSREKLYMKSVYFDTEEGFLAENDIAFRVRMEGSRIVASLKWNGKNDGPLHAREEINVPINDEACLIKPDPMIFKESEIGRQIIELIGNRELINVMEFGFLRRRVRVDTGKSIIEISIDIGEIVTDQGNEPICELELELFSGKQDDLLELGQKFSEQYNLTPEKRSKYARGLLLTNKFSRPSMD